MLEEEISVLNIQVLKHRKRAKNSIINVNFSFWENGYINHNEEWQKLDVNEW